MQQKVSKLHDSRAKAEAEINKVQQKLIVAVGKADRRVRVDQLVTWCEEAKTKHLAKKTNKSWT